jgi:predicted house-cleaning NTP pyrophosphatase (Maf/HAM1 superfamily)
MSGIDWFEVSPSEFAEDLDKAMFATSKDYVIATSEMKLKHKVIQVQSSIQEDKESGKAPVHMIITADTIISQDD